MEPRTCDDPACFCNEGEVPDLMAEALAAINQPLAPDAEERCDYSRIRNRGRGGDPRFYALLERMAAMHAAKSHDYAEPAAPLANFDESKSLGVRPYLGVLVRLSDKWRRIQTFARTEKLLNESIEDAHLDSAAYHLIAILKLQDENHTI